MAPKHPGNRRTQIVVDAPAQQRMVLRAAGMPILVLTVGAIAMLVVADQALERAGNLGAGVPSFGWIIALAIVFIVGSSAAAIWLSLRASHRVVGPALRLQRDIQRMRNGELDFEIKLRHGDELVALAAELELLRASLLAEAATRPGAPTAPASADADDAPLQRS